MKDSYNILDAYVKDIDAIGDGSSTEYENFYDYVSDALDIEYRIDARGGYRGALLALTVGGPTVTLDTATGELRAVWGFDDTSVWIDNDEINAVCEEFYEEMR